MHVPARECCICVGCKRCRESEKNSLNIRKNTEYLRSDTKPTNTSAPTSEGRQREKRVTRASWNSPGSFDGVSHAAHVPRAIVQQAHHHLALACVRVGFWCFVVGWWGWFTALVVVIVAVFKLEKLFPPLYTEHLHFCAHHAFDSRGGRAFSTYHREASCHRGEAGRD